MDRGAIQKRLEEIDANFKGTPEEKLQGMYEFMEIEMKTYLALELRGFVETTKVVKAMEQRVESLELTHPELYELVARLLELVAHKLADRHKEMMNILLDYCYQIRQLR